MAKQEFDSDKDVKVADDEITFAKDVRVGKSIKAVKDGGRLELGGDGEDGDLYIKHSNGNVTMVLNGGRDKKGTKPENQLAVIQVGHKQQNKTGIPGEIRMKNSKGDTTIRLEGQTGDIILSNADFAEDFTIADGQVAEAGMVMALRSDGLLQPSAEAYDARVVGVVSGAGSFRPALILDRQEGPENRQPIAMVGKAFCKVTAEDAPIDAGDLLTSSNLPGYAMKATDASRTSGTVVGKALKSLAGGTGLIPILIALQ